MGKTGLSFVRFCGPWLQNNSLRGFFFSLVRLNDDRLFGDFE